MSEKNNDLIEYKFEGRPVGVFTWRGRKAALAREVGLALGYEHDGKQFVRNITTEWSEELHSGRDYEMVHGEDLPVLKQVLGVGGDSPTTFAPHLVVLFDVGIRLAGFLAKKPKAAGFRRWLAEEVLPQIEATGSYSPAAPQALPEVKTAGLLEQAIAARFDPLMQMVSSIDERLAVEAKANGERFRALEGKPLRQLRLLPVGAGGPTFEELCDRALTLAGDPERTFTSREHLGMLLGVPLATGRVIVAELLSKGLLVKFEGRLVTRELAAKLAA